MNTRSRRIARIIMIIFFFTVMVTFTGYSQNVSDFIFDNYSIKEGLSQSSAISLYQDKIGYIWVGTQSGANRFDGYTFKQYSNDKNNPESRSPGWVLSHDETENGDIWTSDNYGHISRLDRATDKWTNYILPIRDSLMKKNKNLPFWFGSSSSLYIDNNAAVLWMGSYGTGLLSFDLKTKKFNQFLVHPKDSIKYGWQELVSKVKSIPGNKLLLSTDLGLQTFDLKTKQYSKLFKSNDSMFITQPNDFEIHGSTIYAATKYGAFIYDLNTKKSTVFNTNKNNDNSIASNNVKVIHYSKKSNYLWLSLNGIGLDIINLSTLKLIHLTQANAKAYGITDANFSNILEDRDNNIWIGSESSGVLKYDPGKRKFGLIKKDFPSDFNLGISFLWGTMVDSKGIIWLGEYEPGGGVMAVDRVNKVKKSYLRDPNSKDLKFWKFAEDAKGNIYTFSNGNIYVKNIGKSVFEKIGNLSSFLPKNEIDINGFVYSNYKKDVILAGEIPILLADSNGNIICKRYALPKILKKGIEVVQHKSSTELYLYNEEGFFVWNEKTDVVKPITKGMIFERSKDLLSAHSFRVIDDKYIFIPTYGNGLIKVDLKAQTKTFLTLKDGIPNLYLYEVYSGTDNMLWISSNYGIIRYNPYTNKYRTFGPSEGVQDFEFNAGSSFQKENHEIFFAGLKGLNYFNPDSIVDNSLPPVVIIQKFSKKDTSIFFESSSSKEEYKVNYDENSLAFEFLAFNYRDAQHNEYAYKMEGYDEDWIYSGARRFTSYTNLKEGKYTFRVKASNNDGIWNEEGAAITIHILPPPWRTWWAYLLYLLFGSLSIYILTSYRERQQIKKLENERKNSELAAAKDLQNRLLPKVLPSIKGLDIAGFLRTSTEVGGDYYDFFEQADGSLYAMCGDATGHGTPSGMLVSITKAGLIGLPEMEPKEMLRELNRVVKKVDLGILRMSLNIVHIKDDELTLSSAGMPPYYIYRASSKTTEEIMLSGIPLGSFNNVHYDQHKTSFHTGDVLVIISDGLPEAPNAAAELFDYTKVQQLISKHGDETADGIIKKLMVEADLWLAGKQNPDDITLVVIKHL